ncbi:MAG: hypothetical protein B7Y12_15960 [Rhizobiales bacterium 24-66-13]|jgi:hypothetical protein|nr:MAG: hypothetical protein B7Y61_06270 [Rhizobiales bacterium 35-66-30]OYZ72089.1 MAG: hypothetical protein B7Y12_15960 [Rhizobiales bacterium 24-66-13]OZB05218.1 MAG: hypothetical protein B7X67_12520 [Rhizobiales bacterium 39-66-18]HQS49404.1 flagellar hook-length control protein FliK [Xanthobacteraceae bacterium]
MTALDYSVGPGAGRGDVVAGKGAARAGAAPGNPPDGADSVAGHGFAAVFKQIASPAPDAGDTGAAGRDTSRPGSDAHQGEDSAMPAPDETANDGPAPAGDRQARPGRVAATHGPGSLSQLLLALGRPARAPTVAAPGDGDTADDLAAAAVQAARDGARLQDPAMLQELIPFPDPATFQDSAMLPPSATPQDPSQSPPASHGEDVVAARATSSGLDDPTAPGGPNAPTRAEQDAAGAAFATALGRADATASAMPTRQSEAGAGFTAAQTAAPPFPDASGGEAVRPIQVSVLSRETHFAPIRSLTGQALPFVQAGTLPTGAVSGAPSAPPVTAGQPPPPDRAGLDGQPIAAPHPMGGAPFAPIAPGAGIAARERSAMDTGRQSLTARAADARHIADEEAIAPADRVLDAHAARMEEQEASAQGSSAEPSPGPQPATMAPLPLQPGMRMLAEMPTVRQVAEAISSEMSSLGAPDSADTAMGLRAGPVRVLEIQLHPDDLGTVNVRMRLTPQGLEVRLRASNPDTARMLEQDRAALGEILRSAGYQPGDIQIITTDGSGFTGLTGHEPTPFAPARPSVPEERGSERQPGGGSGRQPSDSSDQKGARRDEASDRDSFGRGDFSR